MASSTDADWLAPNVTQLHPQDVQQGWAELLVNISIPEAGFEDVVFDTLFELQEILVSKQADYGPDAITRAPGGALNGVLVRAHDKLERLKHLAGAEPNHESVRDSWLDLAGYSVIALMVIDGTWPSE